MPNSEAAQAVGRTKAFGVMAKPIGPICNLDCTYCYYLKKKTLFPQTRNYKMEEPLLERFVAQYIAAQQGRHIQFVWQGGEPTLLGVPFFEKVVDLQRRYCPPGKTISNAIQTNGTLVDQAWAQFFRQNDFLVGISIDGPRRMHDRHRLDRKGRPSFDAVMAGLGALQAAGGGGGLHRPDGGQPPQRAAWQGNILLPALFGREIHAVHSAGGTPP